MLIRARLRLDLAYESAWPAVGDNKDGVTASPRHVLAGFPELL